MRRSLPSYRFAVALFAAAALLAACSGKAKSPTEATATGSSLGVATAATQGNGHGGNGGNGNGHGGHGGPGQPGGDLQFQIRADVWNTNWSLSQGLVQAFVTGPNLTQIDPNSAQLSGDGTGAPITPTWTKLVRHQFMARFTKQDAISLFPTAKRGEHHTVTLSFTQNGTAVQLTDSIRIVAPASGASSTDSGD